MAFLPSFLRTDQESFSNRPSSYLDKPLQLLFMQRVLVMTLLSSAIALLPALYFINQNFNFIRDMLVDVSPQLIVHVEREQVFANVMLIGVFLVQICFLYVYAKKMSGQLIAPIKKLSDHLRILSRGKLNQGPLITREGDEYQDLMISYNYFYRSLQMQTEKRIQSFEHLLSENLPPLARAIVKEMLEENTAQMGRPENVKVGVFKTSTSEESAKAGGSRHVS